MRVTLKVKEATRERILRSAHSLFQKKGFDQTTTRDIAISSKIATGTLFNYFSTKESLVVSLIADALTPVNTDFSNREHHDESLEEMLFAYIAGTLRSLHPHRKYMAQILDSLFSPLTGGEASNESENLRVDHLEIVNELITAYGSDDWPMPSIISLHMYWSLFLGILSFWSTDATPHQEETLVLVDQSTRLFVESLSGNSTAVGKGVSS